MISGLIFDLDGTLVDSLPGIAAALNHALGDLGLPVHSEEKVETFIGDGVENLVRRALGTELAHHHAEVLAGFNTHYPVDWKSGTHPYPGMMDLLADLASRKIPMGILSNKPHRFTREIVDTLFPPHFFKTVRGHAAGTPRKPDPTAALEIVDLWNLKPAEVAYIGDSTVDLATARAAGLLPLIFSWGYGTPDGIPLLHSVDDLRRALGC